MNDSETIVRFQERFDRLQSEMGRVVVGQRVAVEQLLIAVLCGHHCLLEGVPGLAKTLMVNTLSQLLSLDFRRIQFTPDLLPADVIGTEVLQDRDAGEAGFQYLPGPIFANIVLADEINRTPPKTQASLLEGMEEMQVTVAGTSRALPRPFHVFATENPVEQEGTYPLPAAQLDRFMFKVLVDYPDADEEREIVLRTTQRDLPTLDPCLSREDLDECRDLVRRIPVPPDVLDRVVELVRLTRERPRHGPHRFLREWIVWGAGPRGVQFLTLAAKARALLDGRRVVTADDVDALLLPVLRHRLMINYSATSAGVGADEVLRKLLEVTPARRNRFRDLAPELCA